MAELCVRVIRVPFHRATLQHVVRRNRWHRQHDLRQLPPWMPLSGRETSSTCPTTAPEKTYGSAYSHRPEETAAAASGDSTGIHIQTRGATTCGHHHKKKSYWHRLSSELHLAHPWFQPPPIPACEDRLENRSRRRAGRTPSKHGHRDSHRCYNITHRSDTAPDFQSYPLLFPLEWRDGQSVTMHESSPDTSPE